MLITTVGAAPSGYWGKLVCSNMTNAETSRDFPVSLGIISFLLCRMVCNNGDRLKLVGDGV